MEEKIDMPKEFSAEFLKGKDFEKVVGSFNKNRFYALKCISGKAKEIKDSLSNPDNPIYDDCNSFDEVCQAITNNCDGKLSGDSIIALAAKQTLKNNMNFFCGRARGHKGASGRGFKPAGKAINLQSNI